VRRFRSFDNSACKLSLLKARYFRPREAASSKQNYSNLAGLDDGLEMAKVQDVVLERIQRS